MTKYRKKPVVVDACKPDIFEQTYEVAENETHNG
nr:MAG TPA: PGDYG protein [Caudoviricetes sp.]